MTERRLSRRQMIGGAAAIGGAAVLAKELHDPHDGGAASRGSVVVLGGGLAGLTASYELERSGFDVQLVEARDRLGGRVHTVRNFTDGQHGESGAEAIDTKQLEIQRLCKKLGLPLEHAYSGYGWRTGTIHRHGRNFPGYRFRTGADERDIARFWREIERLARPLDGSDPTAHGGAAQDRHTLADLLDRMNITGSARWLIASMIESDYGFSIDRLSLLYVTISERLAYDQPDSGVEKYRIKNGNSTLVDELTRRLVTPPMMSSPATAVRWSNSGVEVDVSGGDTVSADNLVVSAPTTALRSIAFSPALPEQEASFIADIDLCAVAKTLIQYDRRIWRRQGRTGGSTTDLPIGQTWETTDQQQGAPGILIAYTTGKRGEQTARISSTRRTAQARNDIDLVFPGSKKISGDTYSVAWKAEPYSGGCWATYSPGQITKHWLGLHKPVGPIHWAGEHTEKLNGYMNSAVASGERVAKEIDGA